MNQCHYHGKLALPARQPLFAYSHGWKHVVATRAHDVVDLLTVITALVRIGLI